MNAHSRLIAITISLSCVTPAWGDDDRPFHESAAEAGTPLDAPNPEGFGTYLRPLDDSDEASRALLQRFFETTPCGRGGVESADGLCDEALALLRGGSDQLARYLIRQVEANEAEGFPNHGTYLRLLGLTESPVAVEYLQDQVSIRGEAFRDAGLPVRDRYLSAIEALGRTRARAVADTALAILESSEDPQVQLRAINAFDRVQRKHGVIAGAQERIRAVRALIGEKQAASVDAISAGHTR
ncbi:MAG: hypothetical protein DCC71_13515 [Proteobacteria bacterium]|nr:MAG: hypothetical protein DCC71_13515 [Pseudomonadota bacterium]